MSFDVKKAFEVLAEGHCEYYNSINNGETHIYTCSYQDDDDNVLTCYYYHDNEETKDMLLDEMNWTPHHYELNNERVIFQL